MPITTAQPRGIRGGVFSSSGVPSLTMDMSLPLIASLFCCGGGCGSASPPARAATNTRRAKREAGLLMAHLDLDRQPVRGDGGGHYGIHRIGALPGRLRLGDDLDFQIAATEALRSEEHTS